MGRFLVETLQYLAVPSISSTMLPHDSMVSSKIACCHCGSCAIADSVHASAIADVSCPATSIVISSSRMLWSSILSPDSSSMLCKSIVRRSKLSIEH
eukprot:scaffold137_cov398-Prasinococcus_capsulatus_cf.AAC.19